MTEKKTFFSFKFEEPAPKKRRLPKRLRAAPRPLTIAQILEWADAHRARTGKWPSGHSGWVHENRNEKWVNVDAALRMGLRTLPGGSGLVRLLIEQRGARIHGCPPPLTESMILEWADSHYARTGQWPNQKSGCVHEDPNEKWVNINDAIRLGLRGLPRRLSLASLLIKRRGARIPNCPPPLTEAQILRKADAHKRRTGRWPTADSGDDWNAIDLALRIGRRSLRGSTSLARLLEKHRGRRNHLNLPRLTVKKILGWADAHKRTMGDWPCVTSGPVSADPHETWLRIDQALRKGVRSLPGGTSLARLLEEQRGRRNHLNAPALTVKKILGWADAHFRRTGRWPTATSGPIEDAPGETWSTIHTALVWGNRSLPGGSSLPRILDRYRRKSK